MNRARLAAVIVALILLVGGFAVARYASRPSPGEIRKQRMMRARAARMRGKAKMSRRGKAKMGRRGKAKGRKARRGQKNRGPDSRGKKSVEKAKEPILAGPERDPVALEHPNVVLIIGCTVRADQLTPYGGHPDATPLLSERAAAGVIFDRAFTAAPWTKAASAAILTGRHPATIGMVEPGPKPSRRMLPGAVTTLAEHFQEAGYVTFGATANPNLNEVFGFSQGFDAYVEGTELWRLGGRAKVHGRALLGRAMPKLESLLPADSDDARKPVYAQFLFTDAHGPATVQRAEVQRFEAPGVSERMAKYRAMLFRFDLAVDVLENSLAHQGFTRDNTVFVLVNDHGEGLDQPVFHGHGHGNFTYPSATRMPFIAWGAGVAEGHHIKGVASQVDVLPTVLELAGVDAADEGPGQSWASQVRGESDRTTRERAFVDTWFQESRRSGVFSESLHCHDDWKGVTAQEGALAGQRRVPRACYDGDTSDVPVPGEASEALLAELDAFRAEMEAAFEAYPHTADAKPPDDVQAELEALGYVDGGEGAPE